MSNSLKLNSAILVMSLLSALAASKLLVGHRLGVDFIIYYLTSITSVIIFRHYFGAKLTAKSWYLISGVSIFCLCLVWRNSYTLYALNLTALLIISLIAYGNLASKKLSDIALLTWLKIPGKIALSFCISPIRLISESLLPHALKKGVTPEVRQVLFGTLWAIPILIVFGSLLVSADARYQGFVGDIFTFDISKLVSTLFKTFIYWPLTSAFFLLTLLQDKSQNITKDSTKTQKLTMNGIQTSIILSALNFLFISYLVIQSTYFFGSDALILNTEGTTYSSYARSGFWELVWIAIFSLVLLFTCDWLVRDEPKKLKSLVRYLSYVMILMIVVLELSAAHRMLLYIKVYGLTELRFYSSGFMLFIIVTLILFSRVIFKGQRNAFTIKVLSTALAFIFALNVINPNAIIATYNLSTTSTMNIDSHYLERLGIDAMESIVLNTQNTPDAMKCELKQSMRDEIKIHEEVYGWSYSLYKARKVHEGWQVKCL